MVPSLLGGVGLFLLGMLLLTDGLRSMAGDALRRALERFTGGRVAAVLVGAAVTAAVQSSSATTLATIGFVSAGLLPFSRAVGIIFGANLGTTATAWIVAGFGLPFSLSAAALPMVGIGALVRLFTRDRLAAAGLAVAGFGLLFVGIDVLQEGMRGLASRMDPSALPADTLGGRAMLVAVGAAMTVVLQSSSAAVATTLAALHAGTIALPHAAALVIGQNLGTTFTAAVAAFGATAPARRTALAHVLFNAITGAVALVALGPFVALVAWLADGGGAVELAAFHTAFNVLGIVLLLPFSERFAAWIERLVPDRGPALERHLDPTLRGVPEVALAAVRRTVAAVGAEALDAVRRRLRRDPAEETHAEALARARAALEAALTFLSTIPPERARAGAPRTREAVLHAADHARLLLDLAGEERPAEIAGTDPTAGDAARALEAAIPGLPAWLRDGAPGAFPGDIEGAAAAAAAARRGGRASVIARAAEGGVPAERAIAVLDALRWIDRAAHHAWRLAAHLGPSGGAAPRSGASAGAGET